MKFGFCLVLLGVLTIGLSKVTCLTNRELYEFMSEYGEEIKPTSDWAVEDSTEDDVIDLPGDLDDDVDVTYLLKRIGMQPEKKYGFWHKKKHHHVPKIHCTCSKDDCKCCITHKFKFIRTFKLEACMELRYNPESHHISLEFTLNKHLLYKKEVELKHLFDKCFEIPGLGKLGKICLEIYDIDLSRLHACAKLTGSIDIKIHTFKVHLNLGCFSIPKSQLGGYFQLANKCNRIRVDLMPKNDEVRPRDLSDNFRKLQKATESDEDDSLRY